MAESVAAQAFADVGGDVECAITGLRQFQMFWANTQSHGATDAQVRAGQRQGNTRAGVQQHFAALAVGAGDPIGLQRLVRGLQELGTVASPSPRVVINKVRASAVGSRPERRIHDALARFAGLDELTFIPDDPITLDGALLTGRSLAESAPDSAVRQCLLALAGELCGVPSPGTGRRRSGFRAKST